jgi:uncharacterized lipoprotein
MAAVRFAKPIMKKLTFLLILVSILAGCASTNGTSGNAGNTDKSNPYDMTYRGGSQ